MFLMDVNVLIALGDPFHVRHAAAIHWFSRHRAGGWATCPLTENGFVRILGHPNYPKGPGSPPAARRLLQRQTAGPGHQFWPDSISVTDTAIFPDIPVSKDITDLYLLALAVSRNARLASLDKRIDPAVITGGPAAFHLISG
jgi:toxin-antitoxin system PIN domain toxin